MQPLVNVVPQGPGVGWGQARGPVVGPQVSRDARHCAGPLEAGAHRDPGVSVRHRVTHTGGRGRGPGGARARVTLQRQLKRLENVTVILNVPVELPQWVHW